MYKVTIILLLLFKIVISASVKPSVFTEGDLVIMSALKSFTYWKEHISKGVVMDPQVGRRIHPLSPAICAEQDEHGETLLHMAIKKGMSLYTLKFVGNPSGVNKRDVAGNTPLILAIHAYTGVELPGVVKFLFKIKADPNMLDQEGNPTIFLPYFENKYRCLKNFLKHPQMNLWQLRTDGTSVLHVAAAREARLVRALLNKPGAAELVNVQSLRTGSTPLHKAARQGCCETITLLKNAGASITISNHKGYIPLTLAILKRKCSVNVAYQLVDASTAEHTITVPTSSLPYLNDMASTNRNRVTSIGLLCWKARGAPEDVRTLRYVLQQGCHLEKVVPINLIPATEIAGALYFSGVTSLTELLEELIKPIWQLPTSFPTICRFGVEDNCEHLIVMLFASVSRHPSQFLYYIDIQREDSIIINSLLSKIKIKCIETGQLIPENLYDCLCKYLITHSNYNDDVVEFNKMLSTLSQMKAN